MHSHWGSCHPAQPRSPHGTRLGQQRRASFECASGRSRIPTAATSQSPRACLPPPNTASEPASPPHMQRVALSHEALRHALRPALPVLGVRLAAEAQLKAAHAAARRRQRRRQRVAPRGLGAVPARLLLGGQRLGRQVEQEGQGAGAAWRGRGRQRDVPCTAWTQHVCRLLCQIESTSLASSILILQAA